MPITFGPGVRLDITVSLALSADPTDDPFFWVWEDVSAYVRYEAGITASTGRGNEGDRVGPGSGALVFDNRDGRFTRNNPLSPYYGMLSRNNPIKVEVDAGDGPVAILEQFVNEWPVGFDPTATDFYVTVRTSGVLRRLTQNSSASLSPVRRAVTKYQFANVVQYWPMEDGSGATILGSAMGGPPMHMKGSITPGSSNVTGSTDALPVFTAASNANYVRGEVEMTNQGSSTAWTIFGSFYFTSAPVSGENLFYVGTNNVGTLVRWVVYWEANAIKLQARSNSATVTTLTGPTVTAAEMVNCWVTLWLAAEQSGADVECAVGIERTTSTTVSHDAQGVTIAGQSVRRVESILVYPGSSAADAVIGHVGVLDESNATLPHLREMPSYNAFNGYYGELATNRIVRLCAEEDVELSMGVGSVDSPTMGAQTFGSFIENIREAEQVDGGVLYEDGFGLGYQPLSARYNLDPYITLDFSAGDLSGEMPRVTDDDQALTNRWTVTRSGGSSATAEDSDSIATEGLYDDAITLLLEYDEQAEQEAGWRLHFGTNNEPRWPTLPFRLDNVRGRALIPAWTAGDPFGQLARVQNVPVSVTGDIGDVDLIIEGFSQRVDQFTWTVSANTSPGQLYRVWELEDATFGRLHPNGSSLSAGITSSATSLSVAQDTTDSALWTTSAGDQPFDIAIGGERMTVTNVTGATSPQTFTVTRSVNGIVKAHSAGAAVELWTGAVMAK